MVSVTIAACTICITSILRTKDSPANTVTAEAGFEAVVYVSKAGGPRFGHKNMYVAQIGRDSLERNWGGEIVRSVGGFFGQSRPMAIKCMSVGL